MWSQGSQASARADLLGHDGLRNAFVGEKLCGGERPAALAHGSYPHGTTTYGKGKHARPAARRAPATRVRSPREQNSCDMYTCETSCHASRHRTTCGWSSVPTRAVSLATWRVGRARERAMRRSGLHAQQQARRGHNDAFPRSLDARAPSRPAVVGVGA